jgi:hypothetical protein
MKQSNKKILYILGLLTGVVVGCASISTPAPTETTIPPTATPVTSPTTPINPTATPYPINSPSPSATDVGAVVGILVNKDTGQPLIGLYVQACFLEGAQTSPSNCKRYYGKTLELLYSGKTDENGYFQIDAIPVETKFFIIYSRADPILGYDAIDSVFQVNALQTLDIGRLEVDAP